jgi:hypothetical protein
MKTYEGVDVEIHIFLTSARVGGEWSASRPSRFTSGERAPGTHYIGGWVGLGAGLDDVENRIFLPPPGLELRPIGRPARSQSLYRLSYPDFVKYQVGDLILLSKLIGDLCLSPRFIIAIKIKLWWASQ